MNRLFLCIPAAVWALMLLLCALLYLFPQTDLWISGLFYTPGEGFLQHHTPWERLFYKSVPVVLIALYLGALSLWLYNRIGGRGLPAFGGRKLLYIMLVGALGSGLIVNATLKEHWGRARPVQTEPFGGHKQFTPPFVFSDAGGKSFSSGHTSGAFALLPLVFLARRRRAAVLAAVLLYGGAVSLARIAAGGHFFSDVIVSILIMYIVSAGLYAGLFGCTRQNHVLKKEPNGV